MRRILALIAKGLVLVVAVSIAPATVATASFLAGAALATYGVYLLAGPGWALLAAALHFFALAGTLIRGMLRGMRE